MKKSLAPAVALLLVALPLQASAQGFGVAAKVGSLGVGADVGFGFSRSFAVRGGVGFAPFELNLDLTDVEYQVTPPSPNFSALVDWHPGGGSFRISGGLIFVQDISLEAENPGSIEIGDDIFGDDEISSVSGDVSLGSVLPYAGIGFGKISRGGLGLMLDLGVGFGSAPETTLSARGTLANDPIVQQALRDEEAYIDEEIENYKYFPTLQVALRIGFGGR